MVVVRLGGDRREGWSMALSRRPSLPGLEKLWEPSVTHAWRAAEVAGVKGLCRSGSGLGSGGSIAFSSASAYAQLNIKLAQSKASISSMRFLGRHCV